MKLSLICDQCLQSGPVASALHEVEPQDSGVYELVCPRGHESSIVVPAAAYELLFELALNAIVDGYYREAVASFTSALERLFEFYVQVVCEKRGITADTFNGAWKPLSKLSERQLGAYSLAYLFDQHRPAPLLDNAAVGLRNNVIHNGHFPTKLETFEYGEKVLGVMSPTLLILKRREYQHPRWQVTNRRLVRDLEKSGATGKGQHTLQLGLQLDPLQAGVPGSLQRMVELVRQRR